MTEELRALIKRFVVESVRREMTDSELSSYDDRAIAHAKEQVQKAIKIQFAVLGLEDFRG